jgi:hypothetical protein
MGGVIPATESVKAGNREPRASSPKPFPDVETIR